MDIEEQLENINKELPIHNMWDGFWVHSFYKGELVISCSFNRHYYRNFDLTCKGVTFFNLPARWDDTVIGDKLVRIAELSEFGWDHPLFDSEGKEIFAIDMYPEQYREVITIVDGEERKGTERYRTLYTYYIVADSIVLEKCIPGNSDPRPDYEEPLKYAALPCMENRVPELSDNS